MNSSRPSGPSLGESGRFVTLIKTIPLLLLCSACAGGNPVAPAPVHTPTPVPQPTLATVTGHLTATNGGQALPGVSVALGSIASTTDTAGTFSGSVAPTASLRAVLTGSRILPRTVYLAATGSRDVAVDAFALDGQFDPAFYRELVRNGFEGSTEPLRRQTAAPNFYIRNVRDDGPLVDAAMLATVAQTLRDGVSVWTSGALAAGDIEIGSESSRPGWVMVSWPGVVGPERQCGTGTVGGTALQLYVPTTSACGCNGTATIRPRVVLHELGHILGFWHTDSPTDVMIASSSLCQLQPSARERYHAALAYRRPVGNVEPDADSPSTVNLAPMRVY